MLRFLPHFFILLLMGTGGLISVGGSQEEGKSKPIEELIREDPREAIRRLEVLLREDPSAQSYYLMAQAWGAVDAAESLPWLERVFELAPEHEQGWRLWADILTATAQYDYALLRLQQQLRRAPRSPFLQLLLAQLQVESNRLAEAEKSFQEVIRLAPEASAFAARARYALGHLYLASDRFAEAAEAFSTLLEQDEGFVPELAAEGRDLVRQQKWKEAQTLFRSLLRKDPEDLENLLLLARASIQLGEWEEAFTVLGRILKQQPEHPEAHFFLGQAYSATGNTRRALVHFRTFRQLQHQAHLQRWRFDPGKQSGVTELLENVAALADPRVNLFLNDQRAAWWRSELQRERDPGRRRSIRMSWAGELVRAGENEAAIRELQQLRREIEISFEPAAAALADSVAELLAVSYLRLGEQQNCGARHTADSCLLPISGTGIHTVQQGARMAIQELLGLLAKDPGNLTHRWLLNLACMTVGDYPEKVPARWLIPPAVFASDYEIQRFPDVAPQLGVDLDGLAGGSILEDFDGDGHLDLMASSWGLWDQLRYYRNNGDGTFRDFTERAGLAGQWGGLNLVHGDYNNDGFPDVLVLRGGWLSYLGAHQGDHPNSLLRNNGDGTFTDVTVEAGLLGFHPSQTAAWADYDLDGWLDLFIGNESTEHEIHPGELFHNNGDGTFTEVAFEVGVQAVGVLKGAAWGDYNNDGYPDLYLSRFGQSNLLYRNDGPQGSGWRFTEVSAQAGVGEPELSFPVWFWDYNNDGWEDLLVASFASYFDAALDRVVADYLKLGQAEHSRLYRNNGDGTFTDVSREARMDAALLAMGANFGDLDNDGYLDCYFGTGQPLLTSLVPNRMFRNHEGRFFQDVTTSGGFGHLQKGHGISFGDIDNDGDQDIYAVMGGAFSGDRFRNALFRNPGNHHRWITLRLRGVQSNRLGIGARIKVQVVTDTGERSIYVTVGPGGSFGSSSLQQEIGLGPARSIRSIEIRWPTRNLPLQVLQKVPFNQILEVREGP